MTSSRFPCSRSSLTNSHPALTSPASRRQPASQLVQALLVGIPHDSPQRVRAVSDTRCRRRPTTATVTCLSRTC